MSRSKRKRSKFELYGDILVAIKKDINRNSSARLTRVHSQVNVAYDRFKEYIDDLRKNSLIELRVVAGHEEITLTERGDRFIDEYVHVKDFLADFGLLEVKNDAEEEKFLIKKRAERLRQFEA